jgi:hypothetical protein
LLTWCLLKTGQISTANQLQHQPNSMPLTTDINKLTLIHSREAASVDRYNGSGRRLGYETAILVHHCSPLASGVGCEAKPVIYSASYCGHLQDTRLAPRTNRRVPSHCLQSTACYDGTKVRASGVP